MILGAFSHRVRVVEIDQEVRKLHAEREQLTQALARRSREMDRQLRTYGRLTDLAAIEAAGALS